jgi:hypothetical protein
MPVAQFSSSSTLPSVVDVDAGHRVRTELAMSGIVGGSHTRHRRPPAPGGRVRVPSLQPQRCRGCPTCPCAVRPHSGLGRCRAARRRSNGGTVPPAASCSAAAVRAAALRPCRGFGRARAPVQSHGCAAQDAENLRKTRNAGRVGKLTESGGDRMWLLNRAKGATKVCTDPGKMCQTT